MPQVITQVQADFPPKLQSLFEPKRYKVYFGGRGGAKSWGVARWLLLEGVQKATRVLCVREHQNSIKDSVHKLLSDQIEALGLSHLYDIQQAVIRCPSTGSEFSFEGIRHNVGKIKSYEGIDKCWVEEAQSVSKSSWDVLIPTIRKAGSEIIATFNPELESDDTYQRFVAHPPSPERATVCKLTWRDNPWFPEDLRAEMEDLKARDYDSYLHVWEGNCKQILEGAIFADELRQARLQGRLRGPAEGGVPYDRSAPVFTYWDLGRSDHTSIWFVQQIGFEYRVIDFYQSNLKHIDHYLNHLQLLAYVYDTMWLPHDAKAKLLGSKMSIEEQVRAKFTSVRIVPKLSIQDRINAARTVFPNCYFDANRCADGIQSLMHYRYDVDPTTKQFSLNPLHDTYSDAADAFCYFGVASKQPGKRAKLKLPGLNKQLVLAGAVSVGELYGTEGFELPYGSSGETSTGWMK